MDILLVGRRFDINTLNNFHSVCSFFVKEELENKGHNTIPFDFVSDSEIPKNDIVISMVRSDLSKGFDFFVKNSKVKKMYSIANQGQSPNKNETVFSMIKNKMERQHEIYWAASSDYLYPTKKDFVKVLIDHPHYDPRFKHYDSIIDTYIKVIKRIGMNYEILSTDKQWIDILPSYRNSTIYCVTHPESCGFSILESAMCGATIICPKGYVNHRGFKNIVKLTINNDEEEIKEALMTAVDVNDEETNIKKASFFSWDKTVDKILEVIENEI